MMKFKKLLLIALSLLAALQTRAQNSYVQTLHTVNKQITTAYLRHDTAALMRIYADQAVRMPEYHLTLFGKKAIGDYLRTWMDSARVDSYSRQTHDITKAGNYLVETGTFSNQFSLRNKAVDYDGKYLNIWQITSGGSLKLISEIVGSAKSIERGSLPLSTLQIPDMALLPKPKVDQTSAAIQSLNNQVAELVVQRRGKEFAKYYTADAIYAPYYMPMLIGRSAIDAYYREHENPNNIIGAVHIGASRIIDAGNYILVDAYYKVDWGGSTDAHGTVTGKNITVWKRDQNGQLLMFRQMTVHD